MKTSWWLILSFVAMCVGPFLFITGEDHVAHSTFIEQLFGFTLFTGGFYGVFHFSEKWNKENPEDED